MAERTLFIHAGLHKTGTTAVQKFLEINAAALGDLGLYRPVAGTGTHGHTHVDIVAELIRGGDFDALAACAGLKMELAAAGHPARVAISSEDFTPNYARPDFVETLARFCQWLGYRPHVIACVRPQTAILNAMFTQHVKNWRDVPPFDVYFGERLADPLIRLPRLFAVLLADDRFATTLLPYTPGGNIVARVMGVMGIAPEALSRLRPADAENVTPGAKTVAAFQTLRRLLEERNLAVNPEQLGGLSLPLVRAADGLGWNARKFDGVTANLFQQARASLSASNDDFAQSVWGKSWADVFPDERLGNATPNLFDPAAASAAERAEFEGFVGDALALIGDLAGRD